MRRPRPYWTSYPFRLLFHSPSGPLLRASFPFSLFVDGVLMSALSRSVLSWSLDRSSLFSSSSLHTDEQRWNKEWNVMTSQVAVYSLRFYYAGREKMEAPQSRIVVSMLLYLNPNALSALHISAPSVSFSTKQERGNLQTPIYLDSSLRLL